MNVLWVKVDAIRIVPTPMEAMCAIVTLDTKSLPTTERVWVREWHSICSIYLNYMYGMGHRKLRFVSLYVRTNDCKINSTCWQQMALILMPGYYFRIKYKYFVILYLLFV